MCRVLAMCRVLFVTLTTIGAGGVGALAATQDVSLAADFIEEYHVGGFDAPTWSAFVEPPRVSFDAAGRLYALDLTVGHVIVIDSEGNLSHTMGGKGEGPGEFLAPGELLVWPDGRVGVPDIGHGGYHIFTSDGRFERLARFASGASLFGGGANFRSAMKLDPTTLAVIAQGLPSTMSAITDLLGRIGPTDAMDHGDLDDRELERQDLRGEVTVTQKLLEAWRPVHDRDEHETPPPPVDLNDPSGISRMLLRGARRFTPALLWDVMPDGRIAYSDSSAYNVKIIDRQGREVRVFGRPIYPEPITDRIRQAVREHELNSVADLDSSELPESLAAQMLQAAREDLATIEFFEEVPVLTALRATWNGTLWIQRRAEEPWNPFGPIDVMRASGEYVGTLPPGATAIPAAFGPDGLAAFVELDEFDVPTIVVRRLPPIVR